MGAHATSKVILWDLMDTVVKDPFFTHMPAFFGLSFEELIAQKHPSVWSEFELGQIDEDELLERFFLDGRPVDGSRLKQTLLDAYHYIDGMEALLQALKARGVPMYALSNYPHWYALIEQRLHLSRYLDLSFISCRIAARKPDARAYQIPCERLGRPPADFVFVDDRKENVDAARVQGLDGILFDGDVPSLTASLERTLAANPPGR